MLMLVKGDIRIEWSAEVLLQVSCHHLLLVYSKTDGSEAH